MKRSLYIIFALFFFSSPVLALENSDCFNCHTKIDGAKFERSIHGKNQCTSCHADVKEAPHPQKPAPVNCANCHDTQAGDFGAGIHGQALKRGALYAPNCATCHGKHDILKGTDPSSPTFKMNIPLLCGRCHKEDAPVARLYNIPERSIIEHYRESIHGEGLLKKGLLVTAACTDCHNAHKILPHTDAASSISAQNVAKTCSKCHVMIETVHKKVIRGELWEQRPGAIPACVDCHSPHEIRKDALVVGMADRTCMKCHESQKPILKHDELKLSVHGKLPCVKCHSDVTPEHGRPCDTAGRVDCSSCHVKQSEDYTQSVHGTLHAKNDPDAPYCTDCHGTHGTASKLDDRSPIFRMNVPALCAKCHRAGAKAAVRYKGEQGDMVQTYQTSIHGKGVSESGLMSSAVCIDCHTSHMELPASDPRSSVNSANLVLACARCHRGIYEQFSKSVHSPNVSKTSEKLPNCADCHTAHDITRVEKDKFTQEIGHQCGDCHKDVASTYYQTYHGKAYQLGSLKAAKCSDCHGAHEILRSNDPDSRLSRKNVVETCKKCHPGSNRKFTGYLTHATHHNRYKYPILFLTFWGMTILLVGTFIFFGIHTILWLPKSFTRLKEKRLLHVSEEPTQFVRFGLRERILHLSVIVSFFGLAITGMILKFAHMKWAGFLAGLIGGVGAAGTIHRFCALITFGYFGTHLYTLYRYKRDNNLGWRGLLFHKDSLVPKWQDAKDFANTMKWFFGFGDRPRYGRWTYWEKFDYFAVFWGVAIIGASGLMLWFPEIFTRILPGWIINVATIIHSDEALLAVGFIFTIHFFNTHLRPESFPMDPVIFTGRTSLSELKHDRPREYEELREAGQLEKDLRAPVPEKRLRLFYIFGLTCLAIGITLVILIIYSMLFGYK